MAVKSTAAPVAEPTTSWENPLIPNKRLRELYAAMVELRLLEEHLGNRQRRMPLVHLHRGEEGCLVSTVLSLNPGDLTSEFSTGIAIDFLRGAKLKDILGRTAKSAKRSPTELPAPGDIAARLHVAIGAAIALAAQRKGALAVAYVPAGDLGFKQWKPILKLAATHSAPILFVVPPARASSKPGQLSLVASACGVPGIPVDAADPVALYRVAQESMLRARAGGGPVLMECIPFQLPGKRADDADPIQTMQQFMLPRGVATEAWFQGVASRFAARLRAASE